MTSTMIYHAGISLVGISAVVAAFAIPAFLIAGNRLKKRLEADYGADKELGN